MTPMHPHLRKLIFDGQTKKKITSKDLHRYDQLSAKLYYSLQYGSEKVTPPAIVAHFQKELRQIKLQNIPDFEANQRAWLKPQLMAAKVPQLTLNPLKLGSASFSLLRLWLNLGRRSKKLAYRISEKIQHIFGKN